LTDRKPQILPELSEPLHAAHRSISLSPEVHTRSLQIPDVTKPPNRRFAGCSRIEAALDELARTHLEVEGDLFVDLAIDRHSPQP
jgi:hypothetical protein